VENKEVYDVGYEAGVPQLADDSLIRIAKEAEARIDAVNKIKQIALKVTNARDWTDQQGQPYLQVSGSEKVAGVFNVSWRISEPIYEEEADGHFTFTYTGRFAIPGREIEVTGSRSSKDPFFKKYEYVKEEGKPDKKVEKPISSIDKRDVKMAAMTNLLGNGITRLLGIRNLTWNDLEQFAGIKKEEVTAIQYKGKNGKEPLKEPQKKGEGTATEQTISVTVGKLGAKEGKKKDGKPYKRFIIEDDKGVAYNTFSETFAAKAKEAHDNGVPVKIGFTTSQYGNDITSLTLDIPDENEPGSEG
jgi:hypothetical protein